MVPDRLGAPVQTGPAEIAFFANTTQGFPVPTGYRIETNGPGSWAEVSGVNAPLNAVFKDITDVRWDPVKTETDQIGVFSSAGTESTAVGTV